MEDLFEFEAVESLNFSKMKVGVENHAVVTTDVFFFRHGVVDNFVHFRGSVENVEEGCDDLLIVGDVGFGLDVSGSFFYDFVDGCGQVREDLI